MRRAHQKLASCAWVPLALAGFAWSCAQGDLDGETPDSDPTLPNVDASWKPTTSRDSDAGKPIDNASDVDEPKAAEPDAAEPADPDKDPPPPSLTKPTKGEVLITEVMYDSTGTEPSTEWIELYNTTNAKRSLSGLTLVDGGNRTHVIAAGITIDAGAYVILARSKAAATTAKVPAAAIIYEYGTGLTDSTGVQLANGASGAIHLKDGSTDIAQSTYGGWFSQSGGSSIQLKTLTYASGTQSSSWCLSKTSWTTGSDKGTPGAASDCP